MDWRGREGGEGGREGGDGGERGDGGRRGEGGRAILKGTHAECYFTITTVTGTCRRD